MRPTEQTGILRLFRPNAWTIAVMIAAALCFFLFNTVGTPVYRVPFTSDNTFGWPFEYALSPLTDKQAQEFHDFRMTRELFLSPVELSSQIDDIYWFDVSALFWNILVGVVIIITVGLLVEYRRRMLKESGALRLRPLLWLVVFVCVFAVMSRSSIVISAYWRNVIACRHTMRLVTLSTVLWILVTPLIKKMRNRNEETK